MAELGILKDGLGSFTKHFTGNLTFVSFFTVLIWLILFHMLVGGWVFIIIFTCLVAAGGWLGSHAVLNLENKVYLEKFIRLSSSPQSPDSETQLAEEVNSTIKKIIRDFVSSWYKTVSSDPLFEQEVQCAMQNMAKELKRRMELVDKKALAQKVLLLCGCHLNCFIEAKDSVTQAKQVRISEGLSHSIDSNVWQAYSKTAGWHWALQSPAMEIGCARAIVDLLLHVLVPRPHLETLTGCFVVGELITCNVLLPLITKLSDPDWINLILIHIISRTSKKGEPEVPEQLQQPQIPNSLPLKVHVEPLPEIRLPTPDTAELLSYDVVDSVECLCQEADESKDEFSSDFSADTISSKERSFSMEYVGSDTLKTLFPCEDLELESPVCDIRDCESLVLLPAEVVLDAVHDSLVPRFGVIAVRQDASGNNQAQGCTDMSPSLPCSAGSSQNSWCLTSEHLANAPDLKGEGIVSSVVSKSLPAHPEMCVPAQTSFIDKMVLPFEALPIEPLEPDSVGPLQTSSPTSAATESLASFAFEPLSSPDIPVVIQNMRITGTITAREHRGTGFHPYTLYTIKYETAVDSENPGMVQQVAYHTVNRRYSEFLNLQTRLEEKPDLRKLIKHMDLCACQNSFPNESIRAIHIVIKMDAVVSVNKLILVLLSIHFLNLSKFVLDESCFALLRKGLSFIPMANHDLVSALTDLKQFVRNINLKILFKSTALMPSICKRHSTYIPISLPVTTAFHDLCEIELQNLYGTDIKKKCYNLTYSEYTALKNLQLSNDIIIKQADKGDAVVIMDRDKYVSAVIDFLDDDDAFKCMSYNDVKKHISNVNLHVYELQINRDIDLDLFVDDCFMVWKGSLDDLVEFMLHMNTTTSFLTFKETVSENEAIFLDVKITLDDGVIQTTIYKNDVHTIRYIHSDSMHAPHVFIGVVKAQFARSEMELKEEIIQMQNELMTMSCFSNMLTIYQQMLDRLHNLDDRLEAVKKHKLLRDIADFQKGHIFSWPKSDSKGVFVKMVPSKGTYSGSTSINSLDEFPEAGTISASNFVSSATPLDQLLVTAPSVSTSLSAEKDSNASDVVSVIYGEAPWEEQESGKSSTKKTEQLVLNFSQRCFQLGQPEKLWKHKAMHLKLFHLVLKLNSELLCNSKSRIIYEDLRSVEGAEAVKCSWMLEHEWCLSCRWLEEQTIELLCMQRWILYLQDLQEAIWPGGSLPAQPKPVRTQEQKEKAHEQALQCLMEIVPGWITKVFCADKCRQTSELILQSLQDPVINRHLVYCLWDILLEFLIPECSDKGFHDLILARLSGKAEKGGV
ncbi:sorting nexin-19-like [Protopterus annectens]|uniref:sorting nexin-19-like n=1 Tax=Protopterus annectens TaxID=7888 RepID=UPI001CF9F304|nr:sorting nexin-19-like [Protopterus annectens]